MKRLMMFLLTIMIVIGVADVPVQAKNEKWPKGPSAGSITAESAIVMELNTGTILYDKNIDDKHYPASITKIMTTLLCLENASLTDTVTFSKNAVMSIETGSSHIGITEGEQISMEDCLYGIMLMSANEASNGVAEHVAGSIGAFVDMMNEKAKSLGCKNTHFANPNGLWMENHYTTAHDMALIASAAMKNSVFRKITGTKTYTIPKTNINKKRALYNKHNMLYPITYPKYGYEYCIGGKTGYTNIARWTLVTFAKKDDLELVCVVMKTAGPPKIEPNEYTDTIKLMNYAIENYEKHSIKNDVTSGSDEGQYSLFTKYNKIFDTDNSPLYVAENAGVVLPKGVDISSAEKTIEYYNDKQITEGENVIGKITYTYKGKEAGVADILYDASRLDDEILNQNVSDLLSKAELDSKADVKAEEDKSGQASVTDEAKNDKEGGQKQSESFFNKLGVLGIIGIIAAVIVIVIIGYFTYNAIQNARIRKKYLGKYRRYGKKKRGLSSGLYKRNRRFGRRY